MESKKEYHIALSLSDGARYVIITGDPGRAEHIARMTEAPNHIAFNREFNTWSGIIEGERVLITSTGIGGPSAAIAVEELAHIGADTVIRVGTCGGMNKSVAPGELVIAQAAIRQEGTGNEYLPLEFPAVADFGVTAALSSAAEKLGFPAHIGVVQSKDSFYGQHSPESMPIAGILQDKWNAWLAAGCLASEMECAALFLLGVVRNLRTGAVLHCVWNQETGSGVGGESRNLDTDNAAKAAIEAMRSIIVSDKEI